jgi:hypothetical protein
MFFITKDGVKDWKEGDAWYKPLTVEGYEAKSSPSTGMSTGLKVIIGIFIAIALFGLFAYLMDKLKQNQR